MKRLAVFFVGCIAACTYSLNAKAFSVKPQYSGDWSQTEYGAFTSSHSDPNTIAVLVYKGNKYDIGVLVSDIMCGAPSEPVEANPVRINEQMVQFTQRCVDEGFAIYQPTTETGSSYMFKQFNMGGVVTADDHRFSAEGFTEMYQKLNSTLSKSTSIYDNTTSTETAI